MIRSLLTVVLLSTAFLAAGAPLSFAGDSPDAAYLRQHVLEDNDPAAAANFLADRGRQELLKTSDPPLYQEVFLRAAELKDLQGVLSGASDARSIRLSLLERPSCSFCLNTVAFPAWAKKHMPYLGSKKFQDIDDALWRWDALSPAQRAWISARKKREAWPTLSFLDRHELMRVWAIGERDALLKINPADDGGVSGFRVRARAAHKVLGNHEMTEVWRRLKQAQQASTSLAEARAKVGKSADPRQKALLAEAAGAASPEARLAALSRLFENLGERSRELLEAAPPCPDQRFDDASREVVGSMLKTALFKETAGTFAGRDLKEFYLDRGVPLEVKFSHTSWNALGWYMPGTDVLNFNERYVERYVKSRGLSVDAVKRDPALLGDLARILVGTFVHEAQHHRQNVWARDNKVPRLYHQGDEVEAFQTQALFLMEKLDHDPKFRAFAYAESAHSDVLGAGLERARRMREDGPDYFDWTVPNAHYPEILSNEGNAWVAKAKKDAELAPEIYAKLRSRQEAAKKITMARFEMLKSGGKRAEAAGPPPPGPGPDKEEGK